MAIIKGVWSLVNVTTFLFCLKHNNLLVFVENPRYPVPGTLGVMERVGNSRVEVYEKVVRYLKGF